jgi:hypothetical protein
MKKITIILTILFALTFTAQSASALKYTKSYTKKNGTFVQGHYSSSPNKIKFDNYSSKGNSNPFTGKKGTVDPYKF